MSKQGYKGHVECFGAEAMSERGEEAVRAFEAWKASLPKCLSYDGGCDGDLEGMQHKETCPMFGTEFATLKDAFMAGWAESAAEGVKNLRRYARHDSSCSAYPGEVRWREGHEKLCNCGLARAIGARGQREDG